MWAKASTDAPSQEVLRIQTKYDIFKIGRGSLFPGARFCMCPPQVDLLDPPGQRARTFRAYVGQIGDVP